jgi:hypothetical protein
VTREPSRGVDVDESLKFYHIKMGDVDLEGEVRGQAICFHMSVEPAAPSLMRVTFPAAARLTYEVQTSSNLSDWSSFTTVTNSAEAPATLFIDVPMAPPSKFVRLRY